MPKLYIVSTPIGNLQDITLRAIDILKSVDFILAEDTRVAFKLIKHLNISKPTISFHAHSSPKVLDKVLNLLKDGKNLALVTDAGTPGISDPGYWLNSYIVKWLNSQKTAQPFNNLTIQLIPIPGPSALSAIISVSDIDLSEFAFLGFPPRKKGRQTFFRRIIHRLADEIPVILFESPNRIQKTLREAEAICGDHYTNVGRELTKIHEEVFRGRLSEAQKHFIGERQRGEFVIIIDTK